MMLNKDKSTNPLNIIRLSSKLVLNDKIVGINPKLIKDYKLFSTNNTLSNKENTNFKKAVGNVIKLYSPPKNIVKKIDARPNSSGIQRKSIFVFFKK